jgi:hypothetical protein
MRVERGRISPEVGEGRRARAVELRRAAALVFIWIYAGRGAKVCTQLSIIVHRLQIRARFF